MLELPCPSAEQQKAIDAVVSGRCTAVSAVPGAGKTTMLLHMAMAVRPRKTLILCYNKMLQMDTLKRVKDLQLSSHCTVRTYDGHICWAYGVSRNDHILVHCDNDTIEPIHTIEDYDFILMDEVQDLTWCMHRILMRIAGDPSSYVWCIVGDACQCLYDYECAGRDAADKRYLEYPREFFYDTDWYECSTTMSYRVSPHVAALANAMEWHTHTIRTLDRDALPVCYWVTPNVFDDMPLVDQIYDLICTYGPDNVLVMAQGVNPRCPARKIMNDLVQSHPDVRVHIKEHSNDEKPKPGDVRLQSFCASKGCEADCAIVFNFDLYREDDRIEPMGVAITRARQELLVIHSSGKTCNQYVPGIDAKKLEELRFMGHVHVVGDIPRGPFVVKPSRLFRVCASKVGQFTDRRWVYDINEADPIRRQDVFAPIHQVHTSGAALLVGKLVQDRAELLWNNRCTILHRIRDSIEIYETRQYKKQDLDYRWVTRIRQFFSTHQDRAHAYTFPMNGVKLNTLLHEIGLVLPLPWIIYRDGGLMTETRKEMCKLMSIPAQGLTLAEHMFHVLAHEAVGEVNASLFKQFGVNPTEVETSLRHAMIDVDEMTHRLLWFMRNHTSGSVRFEVPMDMDVPFPGKDPNRWDCMWLSGACDARSSTCIVEIKTTADSNMFHEMQTKCYAAMRVSRDDQPATAYLVNVRCGTVSTMRMDKDQSDRFLINVARLHKGLPPLSKVPPPPLSVVNVARLHKGLPPLSPSPSDMEMDTETIDPN
jgi:hypothetical protein